MVARKLRKLKIAPPPPSYVWEIFDVFFFFLKNEKNEKNRLRKNPAPNVIRNRIAAEQISAPQPLGMESIEFRKFGQRNLGAKWEATRARAPRGLENYSKGGSGGIRVAQEGSGRLRVAHGGSGWLSGTGGLR